MSSSARPLLPVSADSDTDGPSSPVFDMDYAEETPSSKTGCQVRDSVSKAYYHLAGVILRHCVYFLILGIIFAVVCTYGMTGYAFQTDPDTLWLSPDNEVRQNQDYRHNHWERTREQLIVAMDASGNEDHGVITKAHLQGLLALHEDLMSFTVISETTKKGENTSSELGNDIREQLEAGGLVEPITEPTTTTHQKVYTFTDLCLLGAPEKNNPCYLFAILRLWNYNSTEIANDPNIYDTLSANPDVYTRMEVGGMRGPDGHEYPDQGVPDGNITYGRSFKMWYYLDDSNPRRDAVEGWTSILEKWEDQLISLITDDKALRRYHPLRILGKAHKSVGEEIVHEQIRDMHIIIPTIVACAFKYVIDHVSTVRGNSRILLALAGIASIALSVASTAGLYTYAGLRLNSMAACGLFLLYFLGLHHMRLIKSGFELAMHSPEHLAHVPIPESEQRKARKSTATAGPARCPVRPRGGDGVTVDVPSSSSSSGAPILGLTRPRGCPQQSVEFVERAFQMSMASAGPSILFFTLCSMSGLFITAVFPGVLPGMQSACSLVAIGVAVNHFFLLFFFSSCFVLDLRRFMANRFDVFVWKVSREPLRVVPRLGNRILRRMYTSLFSLSARSLRVFLMIGLASLTVVGIYGVTKWDPDVLQSDIFAKSDYLYKYFTADHRDYGALPINVDLIFRPSVNWTDPNEGKAILNLTHQFMASPHTANTTAWGSKAGTVSWYEDFFLPYVAVAHGLDPEIPIVEGRFPAPPVFYDLFEPFYNLMKPMLQTWIKPDPTTHLITDARFQGFSAGGLLHEKDQVECLNGLYDVMDFASENGIDAFVYSPPFAVFEQFSVIRQWTVIAMTIGVALVALASVAALAHFRYLSVLIAGLTAAALVTVVGVIMRPLGYNLDSIAIGALAFAPYLLFDMYFHIAFQSAWRFSASPQMSSDMIKCLSAQQRPRRNSVQNQPLSYGSFADAVGDEEEVGEANGTVTDVEQEPFSRRTVLLVGIMSSLGVDIASASISFAIAFAILAGLALSPIISIFAQIFICIVAIGFIHTLISLPLGIHALT